MAPSKAKTLLEITVTHLSKTCMVMYSVTITFIETKSQRFTKRQSRFFSLYRLMR